MSDRYTIRQGSIVYNWIINDTEDEDFCLQIPDNDTAIKVLDALNGVAEKDKQIEELKAHAYALTVVGDTLSTIVETEHGSTDATDSWNAVAYEGKEPTKGVVNNGNGRSW